MEKQGKVWYKRVGFYIWAVIAVVAVFLLIQGIRCDQAVKESYKRLENYDAKTVSLGYGKMTYVDKGEGEVILSVHGIFGGYDQGYDTCTDFRDICRIVSPSRFGYLGSDIKGDGTPGEQAAAFAELLDKLGIDKAYVLATSAGGSVGLRFALDYPERTKGLILLSSGMPPKEKPEKAAAYVGPPEPMCNDYAMYLMSPLFKPIMGMEPSTIDGMLPVRDRKAGIKIDATITNTDMAKNYDDYRIEELKVPVLILNAKDDKLADYREAENVMDRFKDKQFVLFEDGGHLMEGHGEEVKKVIGDFIDQNK